MAQNPLPKPTGALLILAGKCEAGLTAYATPLNITQITAASLAADAGALSTAMGDFNATRANRTAAHAALQAASAAAKTFLAHGRSVLAAHWGNDYSQNWASAGWTNNSTAVPNVMPDRLALVGTVGAFLAANASYAVNAPPIVFTAAQATSVGAAFQAGMDAVGAADTGADTAREARAAAEETLRKDLRALIGILNLKLTPNDARWAAFGLNAPGAAVTPKAPTNVQSFPALAGQIHATCDTPSGTDHFRWFVEGPGQTGWTFATDTADAEVLLTGQTSGQTVQLRVTAVNPAGESVPSAAISVAVG